MRHFQSGSWLKTKRALLGMGLLLAIGWGSPAQAQFANRSIGFSAGFTKLNDSLGLDWAIPVGLVYTQYLDGGFDMIAHAQGALVVEQPQGNQGFAVFPSVGLRYRFNSEGFRPYAGLDIVYLHVFSDSFAEISNYIGIGPNLGFEYFMADSWSLGVRAQYSVYWWLNQPIQTAYGATLEANFYY